MADELVEQFSSITGSTSSIATQYLKLSDHDLQAAIQLYFENDGIDLESQSNAVAASSVTDTSSYNPPSIPSYSRPRQTSSRPVAGRVDSDGVVHLDSDDDGDDAETVSDVEQISDRSMTQAYRDGITTAGSSHASVTARAPQTRQAAVVMDDEAMARQMQEELYAAGFASDQTAAGAFGGRVDADGVRAPIARTTETLVGPGADMRGMPVDLRAAVEAQLAARRRLAPGRPGIFNQRPMSTPSVWDDDAPLPSSAASSIRRDNLALATGGASEASSKASLLAEMYRPPYELLSHLGWDEAREEGKAGERWIIVNVQDPSVFDCQVLNRDIWKHPEIRETIKEHFIFMQYNKGDPRGAQYVQFYFKDEQSLDAYPHIAIVDPRTGEQVKVWSGPPVPKAMDYLMQLHEFLDRYSLKPNARNPVPTRKPEVRKVDVERMTEEEMLEMALKNSLGQGAIVDTHDATEHDPDALTRSVRDVKGKGRAQSTYQDRSRRGHDNDDKTDQYQSPSTPYVTEPDAIISNNPTPISTSTNGDSNPTATTSSSLFSAIASTNTHMEPPADASTTRIQFRHSGGRIIRRFRLTDHIRTIYEWLKAEPVDGKPGGIEFELVCQGRNLLERLDETIEEAGLKNQTVMVEFVED